MSNKRYNKITLFQTEKGRFAIIEAPCRENTSSVSDNENVAFGNILKINPYLEGGEYSYLLNFYYKDILDYNIHIYNEPVFAPSEAIAFLHELPDLYWEHNVSSIYSIGFTLEFLCINTDRKNVLIKYT